MTLFADTPENNKEQNTPEQSSNVSAHATLLASIKNERGEQKYASIDDALNGLLHSQRYIPEIKTERDRLQAELEEAKKQLKNQEEMQALLDQATNRKPDNSQPAITQDQVAEMVKQQLTQASAQQRSTLNMASVRDAITTKFGDKAAEVFAAKALEMEISPERLTQMCAESPKMVMQMFGVSGSGAPKQPSQAPSKGTLNTTDFQGTPSTLIGNREAFRLKAGATGRDVKELLNRSEQLVSELSEQGISIHDLTNPANFKKYIG